MSVLSIVLIIKVNASASENNTVLTVYIRSVDIVTIKK